MAGVTSVSLRATIVVGMASFLFGASCVELQDEGSAWGEAERLGDTGLSADVAIDARGNAVAIWGSPEGSVVARHRFVSDEAAWGAPVEIDGPDTFVGGPVLAGMNDAGASVGVWSAEFANQNVWANRSNTDGAWNNFPSRLDDNEDESPFPPDAGPEVALNPNGVTFAVWVQVADGMEQAWAARAAPGSAWGPPVRIDDRPSMQVRSPHVDVDPAGNALAVWAVGDGEEPAIRSRRFTAGEGWAAQTERVSTSVGVAVEGPRVGLDGTGRALVVWSEDSGARSAIWSNTNLPSNGWGSPVELDRGAAGDGRSPDLAVASSGLAVAVWGHSLGGVSSIRSRFYDGSAWGAAQAIPSSALGTAERPRVGIATTGEAVAVWRQSESGSSRIWAGVSARNGVWRTSSAIDSGEGGAREPTVAVNGRGTAVAIWIASGFTSHGVWVNRFD